MKLKEKLAEESTEENDPSSPDFYQGFIAGFEKAREMSSDIVHDNCSCEVRAILELLVQMGEEDV